MSDTAGCFKFCPHCKVNRLHVDRTGQFVDPHKKCIECLGQSHDPTKCSLCATLSKKVLARREIQRKVWTHSGVFMSRAKAAAYLKDHNLETSFRQEFNLSFTTLNVSSDSHTHSILDTATDTHTQLRPLIGYGDSVSGTIVPQAPNPLGRPQHNSTADTIASAFADQSSLGHHTPDIPSATQSTPAAPLVLEKDQLVQEISAAVLKSLQPLFKVPQQVKVDAPSTTGPPTHSDTHTHASDTSFQGLVHSDNSDVRSIESEEPLDFHRIKAINSMSEELAPFLGLKVTDQSGETSEVQTLSLFPARKSKKTTLFSVPPEFLAKDKSCMAKKPHKNIVSQQSRQMFRLKPEDWAQISHLRKPDDIVIARSRYSQSTSKSGVPVVTLADKNKADEVKFAQRVQEAAAHSLRLTSAAASLSQLVFTTIQDLSKNQAVPQELKSKLFMCQAASQLSLTASAEGAELSSRLKSTAAFRERDIWLESAKFPTPVVKEAKNLPFPSGSVDEHGNFVTPSMLGEKFQDILSTKYKTQKYADKVAPVAKRTAPWQNKSNPKKKFKGTSSSSSTKNPTSKGQSLGFKRGQDRQSFRGRGRGRGGSAGKGRGSNFPAKKSD